MMIIVLAHQNRPNVFYESCAQSQEFQYFWSLLRHVDIVIDVVCL